MTHLLIWGAVVLAAWTLLTVPLGVVVGRRLRRTGRRPAPTHGVRPGPDADRDRHQAVPSAPASR